MRKSTRWITDHEWFKEAEIAESAGGYWHTYNKKRKEKQQGIELPNQENILTLREKESYEYLGILEADTIKQTEMNGEKIKKWVGQKKSSRNQILRSKSK